MTAEQARPRYNNALPGSLSPQSTKPPVTPNFSMPFRDILRKKDKGDGITSPVSARPRTAGGDGRVQQHMMGRLAPPSNDVQFTFMRTDTHSQEIIRPPSFEDTADSGQRNAHNNDSSLLPEPPSPRSEKRPGRWQRRKSEVSKPPPHPPSPLRRGRSLSHRFRIRPTSRSGENSNLPPDLPDITETSGLAPDEKEAKWEERATILAQRNPNLNGRPVSSHGQQTPVVASASASAAAATSNNSLAPTPTTARSRSRSISDRQGDNNIQEAIRLHESGELERSTAMFKALADPDGPNNALSQVLYGLALRHGWGCEIDTENALAYLSLAASNSAEVEATALQSGRTKGGAAKGELTLAMYELANSFRNGWGVHKDPRAAKQYYETAANLGDTDAMNEVAWCYLNGFGCKKDKYTAAKYYRLAEENGNKTLGNTWIWKDKYNPKESKGSKK